MASSGKQSWFTRFITLLRSSMVGIFATLSDLGTLSLLVYVFKVHPQIANVPSLLPGLLIMFIGNKYFAFEDKSKQLLRQGSLFLLIEMVAFGLNILFFAILVHFHCPALYARLIGTAVTYFCFSFPMWSIYVFRRPTDELQPAEEK